MNADLPRILAPDSTPPQSAVLTVDVNRRRFTWMLAIGLTLMALVWIGYFVVYWRSEPAGWQQQVVATLVLGLPGGLAGPAFATLRMKHYFTYDPRSQTIRAPDWRGIHRTYPRPGYERLEYSTAYAELYEVRADGKRHRLRIKARWADPVGWEDFVDRFLREQTQTQQEALGATPPRERDGHAPQ